MTKMIIYTKGTVKIVENPSIVEKFQLTEESAIEGFYCISYTAQALCQICKGVIYEILFSLLCAQWL